MRISAAVGGISSITLVYFRVLSVNPTTVALTYVVAILLLATGWGIAEATVASLVAVACFDCFFLPPIGQWPIADPQNWFGLMTLLLTAIVTSQLSGRPRQRTIDSLAQRADLERLYSLSRARLLSHNDGTVPDEIARHIADTFGMPGVALDDHRPASFREADQAIRRALTNRSATSWFEACRLATVGVHRHAGPPDRQPRETHTGGHRRGSIGAVVDRACTLEATRRSRVDSRPTAR